MDVLAKVTSKGQVTLPKEVRDTLGIEAGDRVLFRIHGDRAVLAKTPDFLDLAGSVPIPPGKPAASLDDLRRAARSGWGQRARR